MFLRKVKDFQRYFVRSYRHLFARPSVKFQFIAQHSQQYSVTLLCQALDVSVSGYYAWCQREVSEHQREDARLSAEIQQIFLEHRQVYGSPRIHAVLKARGVHCSRKRVVRLMQQLGLSARRKRSRKPTTKSDPRARFAPNRLNREFAGMRTQEQMGDRHQGCRNSRGLVVPGRDPGSVLAHGGGLVHGGNRR